MSASGAGRVNRQCFSELLPVRAQELIGTCFCVPACTEHCPGEGELVVRSHQGLDTPTITQLVCQDYNGGQSPAKGSRNVGINGIGVAADPPSVREGRCPWTRGAVGRAGMAMCQTVEGIAWFTILATRMLELTSRCPSRLTTGTEWRSAMAPHCAYMMIPLRASAALCASVGSFVR